MKSYNYGFQQDEVEDANDMVKTALKLENASPQQIIAFRISQAIKKFQKHPLDTASPAVQGKRKKNKFISNHGVGAGTVYFLKKFND